MPCHVISIFNRLNDVKLIDVPVFGYSRENVCRIVETYDPCLVVVYTTIESIGSDLEIAAEIKNES